VAAWRPRVEIGRWAVNELPVAINQDLVGVVTQEANGRLHFLYKTSLQTSRPEI